MPPGSLIIVETTVPPGTCERVVKPVVAECMRSRNLPEDAIGIAHSYERVMPGKEYYNSIVNFWRVFSGTTDAAAAACNHDRLFVDWLQPDHCTPRSFKLREASRVPTGFSLRSVEIQRPHPQLTHLNPQPRALQRFNTM